MTKGAYALIAAGLVAYFVASQTQVGWLYLFDAVIWSLLVASAVWPGAGLKSLTVEQQVMLPSVEAHDLPLGGPLEGDSVEIKLKVSNAGRFSRYFIRLEAGCAFEKPGSQEKRFLLKELKRGSPAVFAYSAECIRRGHYPSSTVTLRSGGALGLFVRRRSLTLPLDLTVFPSYYKMEAMAVVGRDWVESGHSVKAVNASEFYGSREYRHGDHLRHIHWRNTARAGRFMVKEFEKAGQASLSVAFDTTREFGSGKETTLEYSIKVAASLARLSADSGRRLSIIAGDQTLHNAEWQTAMDFLARLGPGEGGEQFISSAQAGNQFTVVILPPAVTPVTSALLRLVLERAGMAVLLEGFSDGEDPGAVLALAGSGVEVVRCAPGGLKTLIDKIGGSLNSAISSPGRPT